MLGADRGWIEEAERHRVGRLQRQSLQRYWLESGRGRRLLYLTSGGFTAGRGTLVAAMIQAAGYANAASAPGFQPVSLERLALEPPDAVALGFFDPASIRTQHWSLASSPVLNWTLKGRVAASLPADILGCPAWFAADGAQSLAAAARGRR